MYKRNRYSRRNCGCKSLCRSCKMPEFMPSNPLLANAYVPYQELDKTFCPLESLKNGTTFPELVSPYNKNDSECVNKFLRNTKTCVEVDDCGRR